ncbi:hypothetical protein ACQ4PT_060069 [Festuca glaucescens]
MRRRRWSDDLPPDVLREVAGRLHVAADLVSFHAVCKPWRDSRDPPSRTTNQFLPWLLASAGAHYWPLKMRCVFSKSSYRAPSPPQYAPRRSWVASSDGAAVDITRPSLHDPLTGAVTDLPLFPCTQYLGGHWGENPFGIVYGDGTTLLYTNSSVIATTMRFRAALLRPGDTKWTLVDRSIETLGRQGEFCVAYHGGRILVTARSSLWRAIMPGGGSVSEVLVPRPWMPGEHAGCSALFSYALESQGELLWASVQVRWRYTDRYTGGSRHVRTISVVVHALEEAEEIRWIRKDGCSLADRVLFLGSPNSFAVEASLLACGHGGCAYFLYYNNETTMRPLEQFGVYREDFLAEPGPLQ